MNSSELADLELFIKEMALSGYNIKTDIVITYGEDAQWTSMSIKFYQSKGVASGIYPIVTAYKTDEGYELFPHQATRPGHFTDLPAALEEVNQRLANG